MKKIMMVAMALIVAIGANAQPKNTDSALWKMAKKKAKDESKAGWMIDGSKTLDVAFYEHYQKTAKEGVFEIVGNATGATTVKTINQGQQWATNNAAISYAKQSGAFLSGRIVSEIGADIEAMSLDNFYEGYETLVQKEIRGELIKSFGLYREKKGNGIDYKAFFVVSEEDACNARMRAMQSLIKESEFARKHAEDISKFVREGFAVQAE